MKAIRIVLILGALAAAFLGGFIYAHRQQASSGKGSRKILYYVDPMHPWYKSDKPGIAPDCGMKLEPVYADAGGAAPAQQAEKKPLYYADPQDPKYKSDEPGINPETGNDLQPVYSGGEASVPHGTLQISPEKQQLIGVRLGTAELTSGVQDVRTVGRVALDEKTITRVHTRVEGWIQRVNADFTGELVKQGQPLLTLYSPELLATQQELLLALKANALMAKSSMHESHENSTALVEAARKRLELWNMAPAQVAELEASGKPSSSVTVFSPVSGFVMTRNAFPGQKIAPETELYVIADLSRVWVMADVFESDAALVHPGLMARITSPSDPTLNVLARVAHILPQVDPTTRTLKVRLELNNPGFSLKPEMYVDVVFQAGGPERLSVPAEAVLDSGTTKTIFIDRGDGHFEPRHVETGRRIGDRVEIVRGLERGEHIVISGAFLLNSESQLKSSMSGMTHD